LFLSAVVGERWRARNQQKQPVITIENPRVGSSILPLATTLQVHFNQRPTMDSKQSEAAKADKIDAFLTRF